MISQAGDLFDDSVESKLNMQILTLDHDESDDLLLQGVEKCNGCRAITDAV